MSGGGGVDFLSCITSPWRLSTKYLVSCVVRPEGRPPERVELGVGRLIVYVCGFKIKD